MHSMSVFACGGITGHAQDCDRSTCRTLTEIRNEAESGECFTCGKNFLLVEKAIKHIIECRKAK